MNPHEQLTILIIDDDLINRRLLEKMLSKEGYRVMGAENGPKGREYAVMYHPDLIILDVLMPGEDGFTVIQWLKDHPQTATIPVIFLTGKEDVESKIQGFDLGAVDYIVKPCYPQEVRARVRLHLKLSLATNVLLTSQAEKLKQLHEVQTSMLVRPEELPEAHFGVYYNSLLEAGGDFYEVVQISPALFGYFLGDVSGHDIGTSFITAALKALLKQHCLPIYDPAESMHMLNSVLREILPEGKYLTACYVRLNRETMSMTIINAAHPPLLYLPGHGEAQLIEVSGDVLGMWKEVSYGRQDIHVERGDRFFLYSDGLLERPGKRTAWAGGMSKLLVACNHVRATLIEEAAEQLAKLMQDPACAPEDDIVVLAIEV
jgi:sigma-B regulation protein RsbU (phosphoserine phosphatase)